MHRGWLSSRDKKIAKKTRFANSKEKKNKSATSTDLEFTRGMFLYYGDTRDLVEYLQFCRRLPGSGIEQDVMYSEASTLDPELFSGQDGTI
jgi:hypothetical protein